MKASFFQKEIFKKPFYFYAHSMPNELLLWFIINLGYSGKTIASFLIMSIRQMVFIDYNWLYWEHIDILGKILIVNSDWHRGCPPKDCLTKLEKERVY